MTDKITLQVIEDCRAEMHRKIDEHFDALLHALQLGGQIQLPPLEQISYHLYTTPAFFKGKKPAVVIFPDGRSVPVVTWRNVITEIMRDCVSNPEFYERMSSLCNRAVGRLRVILAHTAAELESPIEVAEDIFFEGRFDTEYLIKMATERVLGPIGYDYQQIQVVLRIDNNRS